MSLESIINAIKMDGAAAIAQIEEETTAQVQTILARAEAQAQKHQEAAYQAATKPTAAESARMIHQAQSDALQVIAAAREEIVAAILVEVRQRLMNSRQQSDYPALWQRLVDEALESLGQDEKTGAVLEIDARDIELVQSTSRQQLTVSPILNCWGGVVIRSVDGRISVTNTLESRLARAESQLRQEVAVMLDV